MAKLFEALISAMEKMLGVTGGTFFERMTVYWKF